MKISFFSPSKLNLFFRVLRKREDSFHEIASLYQTIDMGDTLEFSFSKSSDQFTTDCEELTWNKSNLVFRAVQLFREKTNETAPLNVHLTKRIPIGAGLGGGSGNAATTLFALKTLFKKDISDSVLAGWGAALGSDVPFFLSHGTAYCTGRGEIIEEIVPQDNKEVWIAYPPYGLSTKEVYGKAKPNALSHENPLALLDSFQKGMHSACINDLEFPAFILKPRLNQLKLLLKQNGFEHVAMTGSGTAFFCFGNPLQKTLSELKLFKSSFISRKKGDWYSLPSIKI